MFEMIFYAMPIVVAAFFVVSLILFLSAKGKNRKQPGTVPSEEIKWKKLLLIISAVTLLIYLAIAIGLILLIATAVAFM